MKHYQMVRLSVGGDNQVQKRKKRVGVKKGKRSTTYRAIP